MDAFSLPSRPCWGRAEDLGAAVGVLSSRAPKQKSRAAPGQGLCVPVRCLQCGLESQCHGAASGKGTKRPRGQLILPERK